MKRYLTKLLEVRLRTWVEIGVWAFLLIYVGPRLLPQLSAVIGLGGTVGDAPEFSVQTLNGETFSLSEYRGQVVLVNFWATWCGPCRLEMPALQNVHEDKARLGLVTLGISTDVGGRNLVEAFLTERGITYPVAIGGQSLKQAFGGVPHIPTTFIIDRHGVIRHRVTGLFLEPAIRVAVNRLLEEDSP